MWHHRFGICCNGNPALVQRYPSFLVRRSRLKVVLFRPFQPTRSILSHQVPSSDRPGRLPARYL